MRIKYEQVPKQQDSSFYGYLKSVREYCFDMHYHPEYELVYFAGGSGKAYAMDSLGEYQEGDVFLFAPNIPHTFVSQNPQNQAIVVQFVRDFLGKEFWGNKDVEGVRRLLDRSRAGLRFKRMAEKDFIESLCAIPEQTGLQRLLSLLKVLDGLGKCSHYKKLIAAKSLALPRQSDALLRVLNYAHGHLTEEISVAKVAEMTSMSQSGFVKFFKRSMGHPFNDYVIDMRIERACELLNSSERSVLDVCYDSGFNNLSNFNRQFRKRKKMPPRQYRKVFNA